MKMWTALFVTMVVLVAQAHAAALPEETSESTVSKDLESSVPKDLESVVSVSDPSSYVLSLFQFYF